MADMFSKASDRSDIVLIVEGHRLHVNKIVVALASPVFEAMFKSDFKEKEVAEIPLPGKKYEDFLEFLLCLYPHSMKPVTAVNVEVVLPLADEYQVEYLRRMSDAALLASTENKLSDEKLVHILVMADKYGLDKTRTKTIDMAVSRSYEKLDMFDEFVLVSLSAKNDILLKELKKIHDLYKKSSSVAAVLGNYVKESYKLMPILGCSVGGHALNCTKCNSCLSCVKKIIRKREEVIAMV